MLTKEEIYSLHEKVGDDPALKRILDRCIALTSDSALVEFYEQFMATIKVMTADLKGINDVRMNPNNLFISDDPRFDRALKLLVSAEKIFDGLKKGRDIIVPASESSPVRGRDKKTAQLTV